MNVPAIAKKTFEELRDQTEFLNIVHLVLESLKKLKNFHQRVTLVHGLVDEFNNETFSHPLVKSMSPCKMGCSACCHTQVSVTDDEADLLVKRIVDEDIDINFDRLLIQFQAKNDSDAYYRIGFEDRKCIFLDEAGACKVYADRPSVCRTNVVLGSPKQCDTKEKINLTRLVKTPKSDMAIYASFLFSQTSGTLPYMIGKRLKIEE